MAMRGPEHLKKAEDLLSEVRHERNETERSRKLQEAQVHATLALVTAVLQGGQLTDKQLHDWRVFGVRF
jgi:hypothetical protein